MIKVCAVLLLCVGLAGCTLDEQVRFADGSYTQMSHWQDRWLVINYWAEWCAPCRHEIPEFNVLHDERVSNGLVMLGVNYDNLQGDKLQDVIARMDIQFPVLAEDPQQRYGYERAQTLPMTVIINPAREVHDVLVGPQTRTSVLAALN